MQQLLLTLERENNKFPKLASSSIWYRIADEDAHGIPKWGCPIYLIVSGNGDSFMANCHCANDRQVVYQLVVRGDGQLVVRNARALKAAIFQSLFPDLAHYPEAWWSQSPAAVNFQEPAEAKVWLLMMLIESLHGMSDFAMPAFFCEGDEAFCAVCPSAEPLYLEDIAALRELAEG